MKPVIVHVVQHLKPGGIESFALEFQRAAQPFFDVHIISLEKQNVKCYWNNIDGFKAFIHMLDKKPGWQANIFTQLKQFFIKVKPMYVHTHHIGPLIYGGIGARLANVPHIIHTEHDAWHLADFKPRLLQKLIVTLVRPIYVADANFVAEQVNRLMPSLNPVVITNGIDTNKFKPSTVNKQQLLKQAGLPTELKFIGCAARLESVKAHDVLINAMHNLPSNIGLLLAGTGSLKAQIAQQIIDLHLEKRVFFLGHVEDMTTFYPLIDVFCLSSNNEGLPLSPMEAQACGVPVVLTDVGGCKEAVCSKTGLVVQPNNPALLSQALLSSLNQKNTLSPRVFIENKRSIDKMISQYVSLTQADLRWKLC
ncbi:glycosyltransferase [Colwellia psychrerythraea]|uniref:Glycosyl transferase group 1 n=1 Tax=Colwellia psychrerythraea TaxID=28229 RepID=A0A099K6Z7_COLPS|nr:glycosyltransferase [Colwellia psychrerythraea]KGJ86559.1 glycosyl transferase group 1 [Colwellia psychrerythraea]